MDLFEPLDLNYEYKVIVTNKNESAKSVVLFHNGRLTRPQGKLTITMGINPAVKKDLLHFLDVLQKAA